MVQLLNERIEDNTAAAALVRALETGLIFVDAEGQVVGMTDEARRNLNGDVHHVELPPTKQDVRALNCFLTSVDLPVEGGEHSFCVLQVIDDQGEATRGLHSMIDGAVADIMAEPSWLTRPLTEKIKAWCQAVQPTARAADIDVLTAREREILALICDGRSDAEMGRTLGVSQNTVRNHVASLFRKIGVNRRSAAIIWARERGITRYDADARAGRKRMPTRDDVE